jgi:hypothetical protein
MGSPDPTRVSAVPVETAVPRTHRQDRCGRSAGSGRPNKPPSNRCLLRARSENLLVRGGRGSPARCNHSGRDRLFLLRRVLPPDASGGTGRGSIDEVGLLDGGFNRTPSRRPRPGANARVPRNKESHRTYEFPSIAHTGRPARTATGRRRPSETPKQCL